VPNASIWQANPTGIGFLQSDGIFNLKQSCTSFSDDIALSGIDSVVCDEPNEISLFRLTRIPAYQTIHSRRRHSCECSKALTREGTLQNPSSTKVQTDLQGLSAPACRQIQKGPAVHGQSEQHLACSPRHFASEDTYGDDSNRTGLRTFTKVDCSTISAAKINE
jgi:hypothetical protein